MARSRSSRELRELRPNMLHERLFGYLAAVKSESSFAYLAWLSLEFAARSSSRGVLGMLAFTVRLPARAAARGVHAVVCVF
jgi:hypothetical protein